LNHGPAGAVRDSRPVPATHAAVSEQLDRIAPRSVSDETRPAASEFARLAHFGIDAYTCLALAGDEEHRNETGAPKVHEDRREREYIRMMPDAASSIAPSAASGFVRPLDEPLAAAFVTCVVILPYSMSTVGSMKTANPSRHPSHPAM